MKPENRLSAGKIFNCPIPIGSKLTNTYAGGDDNMIFFGHGPKL
jgi:hypothetical protein